MHSCTGKCTVNLCGPYTNIYDVAMTIIQPNKFNECLTKVNNDV